MSDYAPDQPIHPALKEIIGEYTDALRNVPMTDALQRVHTLEQLTLNLAWVLDKLIRERDAALAVGTKEGI